MTEDYYFLDEARVKVTAASIGISQDRWECVEEICPEQVAKEIMEEFRFDQLPIVPDKGVVTQYYSTVVPNDYSVIEKRTIQYDDILPLDTPLTELIEKFITTGKHCYFLSMHHKIVGLVSIGNINCKQAQVYLFDLICDLERELAEFLIIYKRNDIRNWVESKVNDMKDSQDKYAVILTEYDHLVSKGLENHITEHFYLVDLFTSIKHFDLHKKLDYSGTQWNKLSSINEIRNRVAHPNRSLINNMEEFTKLVLRLKRIYDLLFRLRRHKQGH